MQPASRWVCTFHLTRKWGKNSSKEIPRGLILPLYFVVKAGFCVSVVQYFYLGPNRRIKEPYVNQSP
jgi:hypothetical protein